MVTMKLHVEKSPQRDMVDFFLVGRDANDYLYVGMPVAVEIKQNIEIAGPREPTFSIPTDQAQNFIDELWNAGFRPSEEMSLGAYQAQGKHLADMQMIAFRLMDVMIVKSKGE